MCGRSECFSAATTIDVFDERGEPIHDDTFLLLCNAFHDPVNFILPGTEDVRWELILDTHDEAGFLKTTVAVPGGGMISSSAGAASTFSNRQSVSNPTRARSHGRNTRANNSARPRRKQ